jgi:hypothetical protein
MRRGLAHGRSCAWEAADTRALCKAFKRRLTSRRCRRTTSHSFVSIFTELLGAAGCTHAPLLTRHAYVEGTYEEYDRRVTDESTTSARSEGLWHTCHFRFHPANLPEHAAPSH